jgi:hypothetical protein
MPAIDFAAMPDDARLWIAAAARPLTRDEVGRVERAVDDFLAGWNAHGHPVVGAREMRHGRFLMIAADERATGVSGCSIDSLFRVLRSLEEETGISMLDSSLVHYRDESGEIRAVTRPEFREMARTGRVDATTPVFDNTVAAVGGARGDRWELPAGESWHARAFGLTAAPVQ